MQAQSNRPVLENTGSYSLRKPILLWSTCRLSQTGLFWKILAARAEENLNFSGLHAGSVKLASSRKYWQLELKKTYTSLVYMQAQSNWPVLENTGS